MFASSSPAFHTSPFAGPALDWSSWTNAVLGGTRGDLYGVRFGWVVPGCTPASFDGGDQVVRTGAYAADGQFARVTLSVGTLTWASDGARRIVGCLEVGKAGEFYVEAYPAHDFPHRAAQFRSPADRPRFTPYVNPARFEPPCGGEILGSSPGVAVDPGETFVPGGWLRIGGRAVETRPESEGVGYFRLRVATAPAESGHSPTPPGAPFEIPHDRSAWLRWSLAPGERLFLVAETSDAPFAPAPPPEEGALAALVARAEAEHARTRLHGSGPLAAMAEPMVNELGWTSCWHPFERIRWTPPGRGKWMGDGYYNVWGWDEHFTSVIAGAFDPVVARDNLKIGGSDLRIGPYAAWTYYARTGDQSALGAAYVRFRGRQAPGDHALVRDVGGGMDDTPMREQWKGSRPMYGIDTTCFKALSAELLARMAGELGFAGDAAGYRRDHAELVRQIEETFWHEETGIYRNRYVSGEWPVTEGPTSFYPLLLGSVTPERIPRLLAHLLDERRFWGRWVLPTLAKDDPQYGKEGCWDWSPFQGWIMPPYAYWRGAIWPPPNYVVFEGLRRSGQDEVAARLAERCVALWRENWEPHGIAPENFHPETGGLVGDGIRPDGTSHAMSHAHQSWSMLLPYLGVKEFIDVEMWGEPDTLRFGAETATERSKLRNYRWRGASLDVWCGPEGFGLSRNGRVILAATGGAGRVRHLRVTTGGDNEISGCAFDLSVRAPITLEVLPDSGPSKAPLTLPGGRYRVTCEGGTLAVAPRPLAD